MKRDCSHEKSIDYDKVLADLREIFSNDSAARLLFMEEEVKEARENWICIDVELPEPDRLPQKSRHDI